MRFDNHFDIILIQEMHLTNEDQLTNFRKRFTGFNIICSIGNWNAGGVAVMINKKIEIVDTGTDHDGRIAYAKIIMEKETIVIASVYAPAQMNERKKFLEELHLFIPTSLWSIIGGDFNCVVNPKIDRNILGGQTDVLSYKILKRNFLVPLHLTELFRYKHPKEKVYSYHNFHSNIHSRIDLFFGTDQIKRNINMIYYTPIGVSDHDGLAIKVKIPSPTTTTASTTKFNRWICNPAVVKRSSFLTPFQKIWDVISYSADFDSLHWWLDLKSSIILLLQDEQKEMIRENRQEMRNLQQRYRYFSRNPNQDDMVQMEMIRSEMKKLLEKRIAANTHGLYERDIQSLGTLAKSGIAIEQRNKSNVKFLIHPTKGKVDSIDDMIEIASDFYKNLYKKQQIDTNLWSTLFDGIPMLNDQDKDKLDADLSYEEVHKAVCGMPKRRAPGEDGLTAEVWEVIFPIVGHRYIQMVNKAKEKGQFLPGFLNALLTLIKKDGATEGLMKGFRPLSLMNLDYKILSKTLSNRLKLVIGRIIHMNQTYCVPGRMINDNIHLIRSIIEDQKRLRDPIGIILWDQEKAFDKVNHGYLLAVLQAFGFGESFIRWISLLYSNGSFKIRLNNSLSNPIESKSGVRQGCALSASLFIIALEPLLHRIRTNPRITGIKPPGSQYLEVQKIIFPNRRTLEEYDTVKVLGYADDLTTFVRNCDEENETLKMLNLFNASSGGKTNTEKTEMLWMSDWLPPPAFKSKVKQDYCTFLGVPLDGQGQIPQGIIDQRIAAVKTNMAIWNQYNLSYNERCLILRTFILSRLMYLLAFVKIPCETTNHLQKLINMFFWKNKRPTIAFRTLVGRKWNGGLALPCIKSMIDSVRIKCGCIMVLGTKPALWQYYALITSAGVLRRFAPRLWSNLTPHVEDSKLFFYEVATKTEKWLGKGDQQENTTKNKSLYWKIIERDVFRTPKCIERISFIKEIQFFRMIHQSRLPTKVFDVWFVLAHSGLNTRSRLGNTFESKCCLFCQEIETTPHLFTSCTFFNSCFNEMKNQIMVLTKYQLQKNEHEIVYLNGIQKTSTDINIQQNVVFLIGAYIWSVWTTRNMTIGRYRRPDKMTPTRLYKSLATKRSI